MRVKLISQESAMIAEGRNPLQRDLDAAERRAWKLQELLEEVQARSDQRIGALEVRNQQMRDALEDVQRSGDPGGVLGKVLEKGVYETLCEEFPADVITPVLAGKKGGDLIVAVRTSSGATAGRVLVEVKNTKNFMSAWLVKAKADAAAAQADVALIVTRTMPRKAEYSAVRLDGVYICRPADVTGYVSVLRHSLITVAAHRAVAAARSADGAADTLFEALTSPVGLNRFQALYDSHQRALVQLTGERAAADLAFRKRETELRASLSTLMEITADVQGAIGGQQASGLQGILELPG
jgi:hypothetical protein